MAPMYDEPTWKELLPVLTLDAIVLFLWILHSTILRHHHQNQELRQRQHTIFLTLRVKEFWFWITNPIFRFFLNVRAHPNTISFLGFLLTLVAAGYFGNGYLATGGWI